MAKGFKIDAKVYPTVEGNVFSILDMLNYFSKYGAMRISDLHLKVGTPPAYRIDGNLIRLRGEPLTEKQADQLIYPLMTEENLQKLDTEKCVDLSHRLGDLQFRINIFMENDGICAAIRALSMDIPTCESIGFPNDIWKEIINKKHGLVLFTGITGAGKSTTIASILQRINETRGARVITIEDPVEYLFPQELCLISQREVGKHVTSFNAGLRELLREDPDIVFVGEMRDPETISMTLMAAETGHLVFSTLHTRDAIGSITRILDYFPPDRQQEVQNQLSLSLACIVSQKLLPRKEGKGRVAAMEILNNNYATANLIRLGKVEQLYSHLQTKTKNVPGENMIAIEAHLAMLVKQGKVELLEAKKWANNLNCFADALQRMQ